MTDTYTSRLRLVKQQTATNRLVWGSILNSGFIDLLDEAIAGAVSIDVTAGNVTLTQENGASDQARNMTLLVTGSPGAARTLFIPSAQKVYTVHNACGQNVTIRTASGTGVTIATATRATVFYDEATDIVFHPQLHRSQTFAPDTSTMDPVPCEFVAGTGGTTNPTLYFHREGDHVSISNNLISVDIGDNEFTLIPDSGSFGFPDDIDDRSYSQYILQAGAVVRATMHYFDGAIVLSINGDPSGWTGATTRVIPGMTFSFRVDD